MIFPTPVNPQSVPRFPITWTLVALNIFLYILVFASQGGENPAESDFLKEKSLYRTGLIYDHFKHSHQSLHRGNELETQALGVRALRDEDFMLNLEKLEPVGDLVEFKTWRKQALQFRAEYLNQPTSKFGLSSHSSKVATWITYQFSHASWAHLFSNTVYLIILGAAVESLIGGFWLLLIYLLGGFAGGASFLWLNAHGLLPVVGASGSISAVMAFYALFEPRTRIRFFYFISPWRDHYGSIYLPTLLIIPLYLVSDWASYFASPIEWSGSVAYTAHLGGSLCGFVIAILLRYVFKTEPEKAYPENKFF